MVAKADAVGSPIVDTSLPGVSDPPIPAVDPILPKPEVKLIPGFDAAGQPLDDANVWGAKIGAHGRALDTSKGLKGGIDGWEARKLLEIGKKEGPKAFVQRLLADSMNGTPVEFSAIKDVGVGVVRGSIKVENGHLEGSATLEVYNSKADRYLHRYLAKDPRDKGVRSTVTFALKGDLNKEGGVDNIELEARLNNAPRFSAAKLMDIADLAKDLSKSLKELTGLAQDPKATKKAVADKKKEALELVREAVNTLKEIPLPFLLQVINGDEKVRGTLAIDVRGIDPKLGFKAGKGKLDATLRDFIGKPRDGEPDLRANLTATGLKTKSGSDDNDTIAVNQLRIYTVDKMSIAVSEDGTPELSRINKKGEREVIKDHFAEIMGFVPMLLAGAKGIF